MGQAFELKLTPFLDLKALIQSGKISQRAVIIATYALCNFANIGSIGITIGGIAGIAPNHQHDLAQMGVRSMIGGLLAGLYHRFYCWDVDLKNHISRRGNS